MRSLGLEGWRRRGGQDRRLASRTPVVLSTPPNAAGVRHQVPTAYLADLKNSRDALMANRFWGIVQRYNSGL